MHQRIGYLPESYLQQTGAILTQIKARSYELLATETDERVLDVGCGPGIDTHALSAARRGIVVGIDADPEMVARAVARNASASGPVFHVVGVGQCLPFENRAFDAARAERLLQHVVDPSSVIAELGRVVRVAGRVVIVDTDWGSLPIDDGGHTAVAERAIQRAVAELAHKNGYSGRQLFRLMREAGLQHVRAEVVSFHVTSYQVAREVGRLGAAEHHALAAGWLSQLQLADWRETLESNDRQGHFFASVNVVTAAGVVPG